MATLNNGNMGNTGEGDALASLPLDTSYNYLTAAGNHALMAGDSSAEDPLTLTSAVTKWITTSAGLGAGAAIGTAIAPGLGTVIGAGIGAVTGYDWRMTAATTISGVNQLYNSGAALLNILPGVDIQEASADNWMKAADDNLAKYYELHKEGIDTAGFLAGSIPAGLGAIKAYNYGAAALRAAGRGVLGATTSEATGLLGGTQAEYLALAQKEMQASGAAFDVLNKNLLYSFAAGAGEQAIQGLVFEAGAQIALNASPILSNQDASDIATNLWHGALLGGAIGGIGGAAIDSYRTVQKLGLGDMLTIGSRAQKGVAAGTPLAQEILENYNSRFAVAATKLAEAGDDAVENAAILDKKSAQDAVRTVSRIDDDIRLQMQQLAGGDEHLGNMLHQAINVIAKDSGQDLNALANVMVGAKEAGRLNSTLKAEEELAKVRKAIDTGKTTNPEDYAKLDATSVNYLHLWGEKMGAVASEAKGYTTIWDQLKPGQLVQVTNKAVKAGDKQYTFALKDTYDIRAETSVEAANARALWASRLGKDEKYNPAIVLNDSHPIGQFNTPLIEKAIQDMQAGHIEEVRIIKEGGGEEVITSVDALTKQLANSKAIAGQELLAKAVSGELKLTEDGIASLLNVKQDWLNGLAQKSNNVLEDINALHGSIQDYAARTTDIKTAFPAEEVILHPQIAKLAHDTSIVSGYEQLAQPFIVYAKQQQKLYEQAANNVVASTFGQEWFQQLIELGDNWVRTVTRNPAGGTMLRAADGSYGSAAADVTRIGTVVDRMKREAKNTLISTFDPIGYQLLDDTAASAELASIMYKIRATPERYILDREARTIVNKRQAEFLAATKEGKVVKAPDLTGIEVEIPIKSEKVFNVIAKHMDLNAARLGKFAPIKAITNGEQIRAADELYFPPPNLSQYNHYAFVTDPQVTGAGHVKMIWADTSERLEQILATVPEEFKPGVVKKPAATTGPEVDRWHKAIGDYNRDDALTNNYFDGALNRTGTAAPYLLQTDGKLIFEQLRDWHVRQEHNLIEEGVGLRYAKEFKELEALAKGYSDINTSTTTSFRLGKRAEQAGDNPYLSYKRTALALANNEKIPLLSTQNTLDAAVSKVYGAVADLWDTAVGAKGTVKDLDIINQTFQDAGLNVVTYDAMTLALANHTVARGSLGTFSRRMNSIVAGVGLGLDALNAINNRVGQMIMLAPEISDVLRAIRAGSKEGAGELAGLAHVVIPETERSYLSTQKLIGNAIKGTFDKANQEWALSKGFSIRHVQDVSDIVDNVALGLGQKAIDLDTIITRAFDKTSSMLQKGAKLTGNLHAEEMTRLTSALVMKQLTDLAIKHGVMDARLADSYIQTFVNRTNGVYLASQRPMLFNGPVGQALGLYQTYTITLMNNMLRYAATGSQKSAALMMAAQGTIYGMSGLPGFQAINTSIVGSFAGNTDHKDVFSVVYNAMDKNKADWLMYGALSNAPGFISPNLKTNMYTRGDINPRNISIVPLNPADFPAVSITGRFFGNLLDTMDKISNGGSWSQAFLQGMEHNGVSRPLAGLAQTLQGFTNPAGQSYSTTASGSLINTNDILSFMNLARLAGAKPMDEAKMLDESYRQVVYTAKQSDTIKKLGAGIKARVIGGQELGEEEVADFAREYVKAGGKQEGFNRFMMRLKTEANVSVSNRLSKNLKTPEAQKMQLLMGGKLNNDFMSLPGSGPEVSEE